MTTRKPKSDYAIQTVTNALHLLEMFDGEDRLGVTELSRRLELHKNNVFRLLATLEQAGYIEQVAEDDQYRLGLRCLDLGHSYSRSRPLLRCAQPALAGLVKQLGETAHLGVEEADEVVHLAAEAPTRLLVTSTREGTRLPLYCTALGKVLLAFASDERRGAFDRECAGRLEARTPATLVDRDKLFDELGTIAGQGFAVDLEECETGLTCTAAPVHDASGEVIAALSVSAPMARLTEDDLHRRIVPEVQAAALDVSKQLGFNAA